MRRLAPIAISMCVLGLATSLLPATVATVPEKIPDWFWGCWVVTRDLMVRDVSGLSPRAEKGIIGKRIVFAPGCARWRGIVLKSPKYSARVLSDREFFRFGSYVDLKEIGVHRRQVVQVSLALPDGLSDLDFPGDDVYLRESDIVIEVEGAYLLAQKAKPGDPACACKPSERK